MRSSAALAAGLLTLAIASPTYGQVACNRRPQPVESIADIRTDYLILTTRQSTYVIHGNCFTLQRDKFGKVLSFALLNRFREIRTPSGYVFVKSVRTFSSKPLISLSLSRGDGWFLPGSSGGASATLPRMDDEPYVGSLEGWNAAHSMSGDPLDFLDRLKVKWHAYAREDKAFPSTFLPEFWKIDRSFDRTHAVI